MLLGRFHKKLTILYNEVLILEHIEYHLDTAAVLLIFPYGFDGYLSRVELRKAEHARRDTAEGDAVNTVLIGELKA